MHDAPASLIADARAYIAAATWTFARTMANNPHWYVVVTNEQDHRIEAVLTLLHRYSVVRRWHRQPYAHDEPRRLGLLGHRPGDQPKTHRLRRMGRPATAAPGWLPDHFHRDLRGDERLFVSESDHWGIDPDSGVEP